MSKNRNLAIIPVRIGSKRLPGKNLLLLDGRPLFIHALEHAQQSGVFDEIHISTESDEVMLICAEFGAAQAFKRDPALATDSAKLLDVMKFVIHSYEDMSRTFDNICLLWATNPLRTPADIRESLALLDEDTQAVVAACEFEHCVFSAQQTDADGFMTPLFPEKLWLSSSELPRAIVDNGTLVWCKIQSLFKFDTWMPPGTVPYVMPRSRSIEIETDDDWRLAQAQYELAKPTAHTPDTGTPGQAKKQ